jgi:hypothetical protein
MMDVRQHTDVVLPACSTSGHVGRVTCQMDVTLSKLGIEAETGTMVSTLSGTLNEGL